MFGGSRASRGWPWVLLPLGLACGDDLPDVLPSSGSGSTTAALTTTAASTSSSSVGTTLDTNDEGPSSGALTTGDASTTGPVVDGSSTTTTSSIGTEGSSGSTTVAVTTSTTDASTSSGTTETGTTGDPGDPVCVDEDLGSALVTVLGDTTLAADDWDPPCAPALGGRDRGHRFTAPVDGFYAFDTLATVGLDTVLYAFAGDTCGGPVVACNDDAELGEPTSRLSVFLPQDAPVVVVVDGYDDTQSGPYALDLDAVLGPCASIDLGAAAVVSEVADTTAAIDKLQGSCVPVPGRDVVFRWVVPFDGTFVIDTMGSTFDTVLHVRQGQCSFTELHCNDDTGGSLQSQLVVAALMGTELSLVVDGYGLDEFGALSLHITEL